MTSELRVSNIAAVGGVTGDVTGDVTGNVSGTAGDLAINGTNQLLYQSSNNLLTFLIIPIKN